MVDSFSNETGIQVLRQKYDRLKTLYDAVEKARYQNGLTIPSIEEALKKISDTRAKGLQVIIAPPIVDNCDELWGFVVKGLEGDGWIVDPYDIEEGNRIAISDNFTEIHQADLAKVRRLLTYFVRGERFCDGHWVSMVEKGFLQALIDRLRIIIHDIDKNSE